jgi:hypothetical protein
MSTEREAPPLKIYDALVEEFDRRRNPSQMARFTEMLGFEPDARPRGLDPAAIVLAVSLLVIVIALLIVVAVTW